MTLLKRYALEIHLPGNRGSDVACHVESDEPFLPIQRGDLINPRTLNAHYAGSVQSHNPSRYGIILRVTGVEHFIVQREDYSVVQHKLGVFTQAVDDLEESRP